MDGLSVYVADVEACLGVVASPGLVGVVVVEHVFEPGVHGGADGGFPWCRLLVAGCGAGEFVCEFPLAGCSDLGWSDEFLQRSGVRLDVFGDVFDEVCAEVGHRVALVR